MKPRILDFFCGAGGAGEGYRRLGFEVVGIDLKPQPHYQAGTFIQADALEVLAWLVGDSEGGGLPDVVRLADVFDEPFVAAHASPPCQASSDLRHLWKDREHPELIPPTRAMLKKLGLPYVIENVPGAALIEPTTLCGSMFGCGANGRQLRRHRLFETTFPVLVHPCQHRGQPVGVYGHGGGGSMTRGYKGTGDEYKEAMEMPWATKAEIAQAIPPAYTEHIGGFLLTEIESHRAATLAST